MDTQTASGDDSGLRQLSAAELLSWIRDVPDFPRAGILFKDITPLLQEPSAFRSAVNHMAAGLRELRPDLLVGVEARGFVFAGAIAYRLGVGFAPVRKPGKLPWKSLSESYALEYGHDSVCMHEDALRRGARVAVVDDLLATGGTASAVARLVEKVGAEVAGFSFLIELGALQGRRNLKSYPVQSVLTFGD